jgi:hypothetical protein
MYSKSHVGGIDLNRALNDLVQAGLRDPNILLKYSQNPPPEYGANGKMLVSLAANAVARDKQAAKTMQPTPTKTVAEQVNNKLAAATQPQGIAGLTNQAPPTEAGINTPPAEPAPQSMDGGVASLPVDEGMYNEQNYVGGGIVSFAKAGRVEAPEDYNYKYGYESYYDQPTAALMEVPTVPTDEDLKTQTLALKKGFVDPNFYGTQEKTLADQTAQDVAESKKMGQADIYMALAEGFGTTPGGLLKGATAAGIKARPAIMEMNKNILAAKRSNRDAINKLNQAKYAESVGDFKTAMELRQSAQKDAFEAKKTNATLETQIGVARAKNKGTKGTDLAKLRRDIDKLAVEDFEKTHGVGSFNTLFMKNKAKYLDEFNALRRQHEDYILGGISADPTKEQTKFNATQPLRAASNKGKIVKAPNGKSYRQVGPNQYEPLGSEDEEDDNG